MVNKDVLLKNNLKEFTPPYLSILNSLPEAIHVVDKNLRFIFFNHNFKKWNKSLGLKNKVIGKTIKEVFPFLGQQVFEEYEKVFKTGKVLITKESNLVKGKILFTETYKIPILKDKKVVFVVTVVKNITENKSLRNSLTKYLEFKKLIDNLSKNFINLSLEKIEEGIAEALKKIAQFVGVEHSFVFRVSQDLTVAKNIYDWRDTKIIPQKKEIVFVTNKDLPYFAERLKKLETIIIPKIEVLPKEAKKEKELLKRQKTKFLLLIPMIRNNKLTGILGFDSIKEKKEKIDEFIPTLKIVAEIFENVLERKEKEEAILESRNFLSRIFSSIQDGLSILDNNLNIIQVNPTIEKWYTYSKPLIGKKCYEAYHLRKTPCKRCPVQRTFKTKTSSFQIVPKRSSQKKIIGWLELHSFPLMDEHTKEIKGAIEYVRDITKKIKIQKKLKNLYIELSKTNKKLKKLFLKDLQTGLYNLRYLEEIIEIEFYRAKRYANPLSIIMIDIDYFKSINNLYGYEFGDLVLKQFAHHDLKLLRRYDILVRYGGEEFVIVSPNTSRENAINLANRILNAITIYNFGDNRRTVNLRLSIAVSTYPQDRTLKGMDLVKIAERLINQAKEKGSNRVYSSVDISSSDIKETNNIKLLKRKINLINKRAKQNLSEAIFAFARAIKTKDQYTGEHVENTVYYATEVARELNLSEEEIEYVKQAAILHDLGKIGISEKILLKKEKLTKKEFEEIKKHPEIGADILRPIQFLDGIIPLIFYHHERWDGKGYPTGIKGDDIPIGARIIALADVYQALTTDRPYRKAYPKSKAIEIIKKGSGTQFDPKVVDAFLKVLKHDK
ncbi:MAG: diguanylate cyclase [Candidatus Aenigmatarchaeota archaeon]